jgi:hypothetical protein
VKVAEKVIIVFAEIGNQEYTKIAAEVKYEYFA